MLAYRSCDIVSDFIAAFNKARSHKIERENYLSDLQEHWKSTQQDGKAKKTGNCDKDDKLLSTDNNTSAQPCQEYWQPLPQHYNDYYNNGRSFYDDWYPHQRQYQDDFYQRRGWVRRNYPSFSRGRNSYHGGSSHHGHNRGGTFSHPYSQQKKQYSNPPRNYPPNSHTYQHSRPKKTCQ